MTANEIVGGSFRDPSGFIFLREGVLYRQVNQIYREDYDHLMSSGLYRELIERQLMVPHWEAPRDFAPSGEAYKVIQPEPIPFISYPYEWSFSQLKDAALATLETQKTALKYGMTLKDGSAFNIQYLRCRPIFIDTLSFARYQTGQPWAAYGQFCRHFLAPLALVSYRDARLSQLLRIYLDGAPLDLASKLLPRRTWLNPRLLMHIHLHAKSQTHFAGKQIKTPRRVGKLGFTGIIESLEKAVRQLSWQAKGTVWGDYYEDTNYSPAAMEDKEIIVRQFLEQIKPKVVWDLGANTGRFSRVAAEMGARAVAFDNDPAAVEKNYRTGKEKNDILPVLVDLTNPSGPVGWDNEERLSLTQRGPADAVMALALVHHLAIGNNLHLEQIARFLHKISRWLIIEFVPKSDSQVQRMLASREDIFPHYQQEKFEAAFRKYFTIDQSRQLQDSLRTLYLMQTK